VKFALFLAIVGGAAAFVHGTDLISSLDFETVRARFDQLGPWGPIGFILLYATLIVLTMPGTVVTVLGAAIFPLFATLGYVLVGAMLGASVSFAIGRLLGRDAVERLLLAIGGTLGERLREWTSRVEENGLVAIAYLRLAYVPFSVLNYAAPLTGVSFRDYFIGTMVGILPGTFVFVFMGNTLQTVWETGSYTGLYTWKTPVAVGLFAISLVLPVAVKKLAGEPDTPGE
jgi:uncharacterized membrane protein YdjX (TVP38/TMEM64 family)